MLDDTSLDSLRDSANSQDMQAKSDLQEKTTPSSKNLDQVNLELEKDIQNLKKGKKNKLKKKLLILKSTYLLTYKSLTPKKIAIFWGSLTLGILFLLIGLSRISHKFLISVPAYGGTWNEGIIGIPRYINPVLAKSDPDQDLTELIFSGLMKKDNQGNLVYDLAYSLEESADGLTYTVHLNPRAQFQDGKPLTSDDVIFTLEKIQDPTLNSPLYINFEGVTAEAPDPETIIFHLQKPYLYFKDNLTFGILPKHLLANLSDDEFLLSNFNIDPVGSGPFQIENVYKNKDNTANRYKLVDNQKYLTGRPFLNEVNIYIYQNDQDLLNALNSGVIEATSYLDIANFNEVKNKNYEVLEKNLPNIFMVAFNPNKNQVLAQKGVRLFLANSLDKENIVQDNFGSYATVKNGFYKDTTSLYKISPDDMTRPATGTSIELTTADVGNLKEVAEEIQNQWEAAGINVTLKIYSLSEIKNIIQTRDFQALLFGFVVKNDIDLYAYWDSSQKTYPGTNITGYTSQNLDDNLEILKDSLDSTEREKALVNITEELSKELPAIPLYSNNLNYLIEDQTLANEITDQIPKYLIDKSERFSDIADWYSKQENIWRFSYQPHLIEKLTNLIN